MMLADMHAHTTHSVDAKDDLDAMCRAAIEKGLGSIAFTEHFDLNPDDMGYGFFRLEAYSRAIDEARARYGHRLEILKGIEFGEPHDYPAELERLAAGDFDVILAGIHWVDDAFVGDDALRERLPVEAIFEAYYQAVHRAVSLGGFDVLAHIDLPKRYLKESVTSATAADTLDAVMAELVRAGIALEINTSPLRKGLDECSPDLPILRRYAAAGGGPITLGSDAHSTGEISADFDCALALARQAGVGPVGLVRQRRFVPLGTP
jgi:histidinol-phosphatase (PHP family)